MKHRLPALDWMRGVVMMLMVTDHAGEAFNADRPVTDSALFPGWEQPLDTLQFLVRWASHLCAPVFVFLAGTSLALSIERKLARGAKPWNIDRDLIIRAALMFAVELTLINWLWFPGGVLFQVMFAIGASMLLMVGLRRLPTPGLVVLAPAMLLACEWSRTGSLGLMSTPWNLAQALLLNGGYFQFEFTEQALMIAYPALPWCAIMVMGWVFGRWLLTQGEGALVAKKLLVTGLASLLIFGVVRGANESFGNLALLRTDNSLVQWLHVSKYPPSLSFVALELGIMFVLLGAFFARTQSTNGEVNRLNPVLVFGQTAFFFYLAHILLIEKVAQQTDLYMAGTLKDGLLASLLTLAVLYPICLLYRSVKAKYSRSLLRYL